TVTSATMTVVVKAGGIDATRNIGAYQGTTSWTETEVTWMLRRTAQPWSTAGGDIGTRLGVQNVGNVAGTKVTYDVTALVKAAVSASLGSSRYTRIELIDEDASSLDSYREFYLPSDSNAANRPALTVTYGQATVPTPPPTTGTT